MPQLRDPWDLARFRRSLRSVTKPTDTDHYDLARMTFNALIERRPAVIVPCESADEVVRALRVAKSEGLPVAVRGGGHGVAGHSVGDGALVIDLARLNTLEVDPVRRIATAGGGATWTEFDTATQMHGLATPGGTFGSTGVGGLTLGGGIGHLLGVHGLTCDNLVAAEIVTADGNALTASEDKHADLFWALRGGGGNFGVVTRFVFRLHPVNALLGGLVVYPWAQAREALALFRNLSAQASDDLTCMVLLHRDESTGERAVVLSVCHTGSADFAEREIQPLRKSIPVLRDGVRRMGYLELQAMFGELPFGYRNYWKGHFLMELPDDLIDFTVQHYAGRDSKHAHGSILIEALHGAVHRVAPGAMAFHQRSARFNMSALAIWEHEEDDATEIAWARDYASALQAHAPGGGYLNYANADDSLERVRAAFGSEKFERLREIKKAYDPENIFRFNHNIPPAE